MPDKNKKSNQKNNRPTGQNHKEAPAGQDSKQ